jgi:DNA-binding response OmpR family regulator
MVMHSSAPHILVVDDDLDTLGLIRTVLRRAGFEAATATCWEEVLDRIDLSREGGQKFDLIILDIMMPGRSGFDIFRSLKVQLGEMPPVIFLSARYSTDDIVKASDMGAAKYLVKPTKPDKLLEAVYTVLSQAR